MKRASRTAEASARGAPSQGSFSPAEELLVEFLGRHSIDDSEAFEELCAQQGHVAVELRDLHAQWAKLDRVLGARSGPDPEPSDGARPLELLTPVRGASPETTHTRSAAVARESALASATAADASRCFDDVLARLASHSALESRYRIESELARGGMGVVYKAWDADLRRHVAMKVLRSERLDAARRSPLQREKVLSRFLEEAQITGQLEHPGIVPVHEIGLDAEAHVFFTMPLVRGRELREVFKSVREGEDGWTLARAIAVFVKVCEAVAYAHSKGVVHRDLKPSNVMVGAFGEAYVMDWGLARVVEAVRNDVERERGGAVVETDFRSSLESTPDSPLNTRDGAVIGTPAYMAPEQALGRVQRIGPRSDVYSIGAMLYQLLAGSMPYADSTARLTPQALLAARLSRPPTPIVELEPDTPPELAAICEKAMAEAPEHRYASALELAEDLEAFLGRRPVRAFDTSFAYLLRLAVQRNRKTALALAAGVLVAGGLLARDVVRTRAAAERDARNAHELAAANRRIQRDADVASARAMFEQSLPFGASLPGAAEELEAWRTRAESLLERAVARRTATAGMALAVDARTPEEQREESEVLAALSSRLSDVRQQLDAAAARDADARDAWARARADIATLPIYGGLELEPQVGLVPLQRNPSSGLWEFWVADTGEAPRIANAATGRLELRPESALVLVLLPGGVAQTGSSLYDFGRRVFFPPTERGELVVDNETQRSIPLAPFFIGKTETPQSVYARVMGENPSRYLDDEECRYERWTPLLPVESVRWVDAQDFVTRLGLTLPSEAQWEFAAHCGGLEPAAFGPSEDLAALAGRENLNDWLGSEKVPAAIELLSEPWLDAYWSVAPVMSFDANAWGLHDLLGNVSEACADVFSAMPAGVEGLGSDGLATHAEGRYRAFKGASYMTPRAEAIRIAFRQWDRPNVTNHTRGLRVARAVR